MNGFGTALLDWLLATSCQLPVPFAVAFVLDRCLPARAWPELRAAAWSLVLLKLLLPPTLGTAWHAPLVAVAVPSPDAFAAAATTGWSTPVLWLWAIGTLVCLALAARSCHRDLRSARSLAIVLPPWLHDELRTAARRIGLRRLPRTLLTTSPIGTHVLACPLPLLVLDRAQLANLDATERHHLLLHELTHVRRRDPQRALAVTLLQALFWFHPLVWLLTRRLHALRELCCDQAVVRTLGGDPIAYRTTLLSAARQLFAMPTGVHAFAPWNSLVMQRLHALEQPRRVVPLVRHATVAALTTLIAVACVPLAPLSAPIDLTAAIDAPGCLQRRFAVLAALAETERAQLPTSPTRGP